MPVAVSGGDGRARRNVMLVLCPLAALLFLSATVSAIPEEHKPVQEQPVQEVRAFDLLSLRYERVFGAGAGLALPS